MKNIKNLVGIFKQENRKFKAFRLATNYSVHIGEPADLRFVKGSRGHIHNAHVIFNPRTKKNLKNRDGSLDESIKIIYKRYGISMFNILFMGYKN